MQSGDCSGQYAGTTVLDVLHKPVYLQSLAEHNLAHGNSFHAEFHDDHRKLHLKYFSILESSCHMRSAVNPTYLLF